MVVATAGGGDGAEKELAVLGKEREKADYYWFRERENYRRGRGEREGQLLQGERERANRG